MKKKKRKEEFSQRSVYPIFGVIREIAYKVGKTAWLSEQNSALPKSRSHLKHGDATGPVKKCVHMQGEKGIAWVMESFGKCLFSS